MRLSRWLALAGVFCLTYPPLVLAQTSHHIGALIASDQFLPAFQGFKKKMTELGYVAGKNVAYELHHGDGRPETLMQLAAQIAAAKPDLIVTSSTTATAPVARATEGNRIPVVFLSAGNPLSLVKSYSSSGNNLTGISTSSIDLTEKRLELLKELAPRVKKVITLHNPSGQNYEENLLATRSAAKRLGFKLVEVNATSHEALTKNVETWLHPGLGDAIILPPDTVVNEALRDLIPYINKLNVATIAVNSSTVKAGMLATYAADYFQLGQQGAILADKVLKGVKPSELPIEQPSKLKLVINLATARAIGLIVSKEILLRADEVIE
jgi:putative tryptophan/tyrosine transport system substrate-binding protein